MSYPFDDGCQAQEDANFGACFEAAREAGYPNATAEVCENGALKCAKCPWAKKEEK